MLAGFPNPGPISDQKMSFSSPVFRPGGGHKTQHQLHVYVKQKVDFKIYEVKFEIWRGDLRNGPSEY